MGSEAAAIDPGMKTPPRLCYHTLPSQRREPHGMMTPPLQAPGSVPFQWEEAPGKPRSSDDPHRAKPASARRLEPPPRMALLSSSSSAWQVAKVADAEVSSKTILEGPYYVLLPPSASLFDGPTVMARSNSLSCPSFGHYATVDEGRRKERSAVWFWKRAPRRRDEGASFRKKGEVGPAYRPRSYSTTSKHDDDDDDDDGEVINVEEGRGGDACGHDEAAAAANVRITRFRRNESLPDLAAASTHLWASVYGALKQVVTAPWRSRTPASKSFSCNPTQ